MLTGGEAQGQKERGQRETQPEPPGGLAHRPSLGQGHEDLPGQAQEQTDPYQDRGADAHANVTRLPRQQAQIGPTRRTPVLVTSIFLFTNRANQRTGPLC